MQTQALDRDLSRVLLEECCQVVGTLGQIENNGVWMFKVEKASGHIVWRDKAHINRDIKNCLYDLVYVAKFFCKSGTWLDRITLQGGRLWLWTGKELPKECCDIVIWFKPKRRGLVVFAEGRHVRCPENGLCFGLVFNDL